MSTVTIVGVVVAGMLALLVAVYLRCLVFVPSVGRHALRVPRDDCRTESQVLKEEATVRASITVDVVDQCGVGFRVCDDFPGRTCSARPYLEDYWKRTGHGPAEDTLELPTFTRPGDDQFKSVSGTLELVA